MPSVRTQDVVFNSYLGSDFSLSLDSKLGCNLNNTAILNSYPTTGTTSQGTYIFADNGSTKLLTAGGSNDKASVSLEVCSNSSAPYSVLYANKNGLSCKSITVYDNAGTGQLSSAGIFFGGKNYKVTIEDNSTNIGNILYELLPQIRDRLDVDEALIALHTTQISNLVAVDVTELAKLSDLENVDITLKNRLNIIETKQPIVISTPIHHVPSFYADSSGRADYIPASVSAVTPYSGLYYKNNLNEKINWYIGPDIGLTVGDIKAIMLNFYNVSAITGLGTPFYSVYTKKDDITPNAGSFYKSRKTFSIDYTATTTINTAYALLTNLKSVPYSPLAYGHVKVNGTTIPANDKGNFDDTEQILFFSIGTSSNSQANLYEFIASKFTIYTDRASSEFNIQQL